MSHNNTIVEPPASINPGLDHDRNPGLDYDGAPRPPFSGGADVATPLDDRFLTAPPGGDQRALIDAWQTLVAPCTRIDDAQFRAWHAGDPDAFATAWTILRKDGRGHAAWRLGGPNVCLAGESADLVVDCALGAIDHDVKSGRVENINLKAYLHQKIDWMIGDLRRRASREVPLVKGTVGSDDRPAREVADSSASPLQRLLDRQRGAELRTLGIERQRTEAARLRATLLDWCAWPAIMSHLCAGRPALLIQLAGMEAYLLAAIASALPAGIVVSSAVLQRFAAIVDPRRVPFSFTDLNRRLEGKPGPRGKTLSRNAIYLNWTRLRKIARRYAVPVPPGLGRGAGSASGSEPAELPTLAIRPREPAPAADSRVLFKQVTQLTGQPEFS